MVDIHRIPSYIVLLDVLHHQLQRRVAVVGVLLDGVADIERLHVLDMRIVLVHAECNAVYRCVRLVVDQFQFDMFQVFPYQLAGSVIFDSERAEYGLLVVRAERIHLFQLTHELGVDILQVQHGIYIDLRRHLFGDDLVGGQLEEPLGESVQVFLFQGEAGGIRVATEVFQQVAAA